VTVFDPTIIATFEELQQINSRLAPGSQAKTLPADWTPGKQPVPALPIDEFITNFAERTRKPRLRLPEDLKRHRLGECPYAMARAGLAFAVREATVSRELEELRSISTGKLKELRKLSPLRSQLLAAAGIIAAISSCQEQFEELGINRDLNRLRDRLLAAAFEIERSAPAIRGAFLERSQNRGHLWRIWFVSSLFGTWWRLTGSDPSINDPFLKFLNAAWESLWPDADPPPWESAIRSALRDDAGGYWREEV
jgi:hypothetical protein